jgi:peptide deformylase
MILKLYQTGQPILRKQAKTVSRATLASKPTQDIIDFMISTLRDAPGVGIAAPQVGEQLQIIVIEDKSKYHDTITKQVIKAQGRKSIALKVLVNPKLEILDKKPAHFFEGCLSVDGYVAVVPRALKVKVSALDRNGRPIEYVATNWHARILQHEVDHLKGILLIDRMFTKSFMNMKNFNKLWRKALPPSIEKNFKLN